jgi:hypothetical protein
MRQLARKDIAMPAPVSRQEQVERHFKPKWILSQQLPGEKSLATAKHRRRE